MAATAKPVGCPPSRHAAGGGGKACAVIVWVLLAAGLITGLVLVGIFLDRKYPSKDPVYTVAITGVTGLDVLLSPATTTAPTAALSPVFNLTFQIDNTRNADYEACVPGLSRAEVSYGDAFLAGGSVPPFCAGKMRRSDGVAARAWGESVAVPGFLRDQLAAELAAGDASVDVKVTMPSFCWRNWCDKAVLSCKPMTGGGPSPACRIDSLKGTFGCRGLDTGNSS